MCKGMQIVTNYSHRETSDMSKGVNKSLSFSAAGQTNLYSRPDCHQCAAGLAT